MSGTEGRPAGMPRSGSAVRLTVVVSEGDRLQGRPLSTEIVRRAHTAGLAGATVLRGVEGYGASGRIHTARLLSLSDELPMVITIVDTRERIVAFLPAVEELVTGGLVTVEAVSVVRRAGPWRGTGDLPT